MRGMVVKSASVAIVGLLTAVLAFSLMPITREAISLASCTPVEGAECEQFGGVLAFAISLFRSELVPFELVSVLLTVAIIGAIAVARGRTAAEADVIRKKRAAEQQALRDREAKERALSAEVSAHGGH